MAARKTAASVHKARNTRGPLPQGRSHLHRTHSRIVTSACLFLKEMLVTVIYPLFTSKFDDKPFTIPQKYYSTFACRIEKNLSECVWLS